MSLSGKIFPRPSGFPVSILAEAIFSICIFLSWPGVGRATIIVDQQPNPVSGPASDTAFLFNEQPNWQQEADDIVLAQSAVVNRILFWGFYGGDFDQFIEPPPLDETMRVRLYDARPADSLPGAVLFEEAFLNPSRIPTGRTILTGAGPPEMRYQVDLTSPFELLGNTKYWLEIVQVGDVQSLFRWEVAFHNSTPKAFINSGTSDWIAISNGNSAFQLQAVPEPSNIAIVMLSTVFFVIKRRNGRRGRVSRQGASGCKGDAARFAH
jgi:hypothetical protein